MNDEIIAEVRAIREAHAAKFNYDLRAIFEDLKRIEAETTAAGWPHIEAPSEPPPLSNNTVHKIRFVRR